MNRESRRGFYYARALTGLTLTVAILAAVACESSDEQGTSSGPAPSGPSGGPAATAQPTAVPAAQPTAAQPPAGAPTVQPTAAPTETPTAEPAPAIPETRTTGQVDGVTFVVGEGSEATFTVTEQLARVPLPNDAVVRTTALSGEVHLDGRDSVVEIDLQQLSSDSSFRDRYIRSRMFGRDPIAVFTITDLGQLPEGFTDGEVVTGQVHGELLIRGVTAPLTFDVEARDDGDVVFIIGRTTFTWDDLQIAKPTARPVVSVEDEVRVEVLLSVTPKLASEG